MSKPGMGLGRVIAAWNLRTSPERHLSRAEVARTLLVLADEAGVTVAERDRLESFPTATRDLVSARAVAAWLAAQQAQLGAPTGQ